MRLAFGLLLNLVSFFGIGVGPCLLLVGESEELLCVSLAPVIGFVLVTLVGIYLTLLDVPVGSWTIPVLILGTVLSSLTGWIAMRVRPGAERSDRTTMLVGVLALLAVSVVTIGPPAVYGPPRERHRLVQLHHDGRLSQP